MCSGLTHPGGVDCSQLSASEQRTVFFKIKKHHHHSARGFSLLVWNFNTGAMIVSSIKQLFKAKESMHLHGKEIKKKIMLKEKSFKTLMNPTHIEGQIQIEIQTE
jgi:hypothetical protein